MRSFLIFHLSINLVLCLLYNNNSNAYEKPIEQSAASSKRKMINDQEDAQEAKAPTRSRFAELLSPQVEIHEMTRAVQAVSITPLDKKRRDVPQTSEGEAADTLKRSRKTDEINVFITQLLKQEIAEGNRQLVSNFLNRPGMLKMLRKGSGVDVDFAVFWKPLILKNCPQHLDFLEDDSMRAEGKIPAELMQLLENVTPEYTKWQKIEDTKEFLRRFIRTLSNIPEDILQQYMTFLTQNYNALGLDSLRILYFFGYPHEMMAKPCGNTSLNELASDMARAAFSIVEKVYGGSDLYHVLDFFNVIKDIPLSFFKVALKYHLEFLSVDSNWSNGSLIRQFYGAIGKLSTHNIQSELLDVRLRSTAQVDKRSHSIIEALTTQWEN